MRSISSDRSNQDLLKLLTSAKAGHVTFCGRGVEFLANLLDAAVVAHLLNGLSPSQLHHLAELFEGEPILGRPSVNHRHLVAEFVLLFSCGKMACASSSSSLVQPVNSTQLSDAYLIDSNSWPVTAVSCRRERKTLEIETVIFL